MSGLGGLDSLRPNFAIGIASREVETLQARVHVTLKPGVLDPQGKAIESTLGSLGFEGVSEVRQGKTIELTLAESDPAKARASLEAMCQKLLANTVIENYSIELHD